MASTSAASVLTEAHRRAQVRNAVSTAVVVGRSFGSVVDPLNLSSTMQRWLTMILPHLLGRRAYSERLSMNYATQFRRIEIGDLEPFDPTPPVQVASDAIRASLWFQGPGVLERYIERVSGDEISPELDRALLEQAKDAAQAAVAAASIRHVSNGGREALKSFIRQDRVALGWVRVTRAQPCYFCAMLASRGPVYDKESFRESNDLFSGEGVAKAHDSCVCSLEPIYSRESDWPGNAKQFSELWASSTKGASGKAAILAFRRAYEGRS